MRLKRSEVLLWPPGAWLEVDRVLPLFCGTPYKAKRSFAKASCSEVGT